MKFENKVGWRVMISVWEGGRLRQDNGTSMRIKVATAMVLMGSIINMCNNRTSSLNILLIPFFSHCISSHVIIIVFVTIQIRVQLW